MKLYTNDNYIAEVILDRKHAEKTLYCATDFRREGVTINLMPRSYTTLDGLLRAARKKGINVDTASANI